MNNNNNQSVNYTNSTKTINNNTNTNTYIPVAKELSKNKEYQEQPITVQEIYNYKKINRINNEKIKEIQSQLTSATSIFEELKNK